MSCPVILESMPLIDVCHGVPDSALKQIVETRVQDSVSQSAMLAHVSMALPNLGTNAHAYILPGNPPKSC